MDPMEKDGKPEGLDEEARFEEDDEAGDAADPGELPESAPAPAPAAVPPAERPEYKGRNLEEAILLAEHRLKLAREEFNYEIVTEKTKLFGAKEIVIRAWPKRREEENAVEDFLRAFLPVFGLDLRYQLRKKNGLTTVIFDGEDRGILLRNEGAALLAVQHVLNKLSPQKVQVDCEFFRKRKEKKLRDFADGIARRVSESGREEVLDPMNPYERRIVHIAANQVPGVASESLGDGFLKKVKVYKIRR